jgi:hypothetical protein
VLGICKHWSASSKMHHDLPSHPRFGCQAATCHQSINQCYICSNESCHAIFGLQHAADTVLYCQEATTTMHGEHAQDNMSNTNQTASVNAML